MKKIVLSFYIFIILLPTITLAQTPSTTGATQTTRFTPGLKTGTGDGNTFSGLGFSGVGGSTLSCANIGQSTIGNVSNLFKSAAALAKEKAAEKAPGAGSGGEQAVIDQKNLDEAKKQTQRENCLNAIAYAVAKNSLQQISNKTLNWINTGFDGNPLYVKDISSYMTSVRNDQLQSYIGSTLQNNNPIFGNALRSVLTEQTTGFSDGLLNKVMGTPEAKSYQDFQNDFTMGGWGALLNMSNNPIGAYFGATDQLGSLINNAQQNVKDELLQGNGFLSMKKCVEYEGVSTVAQNGLSDQLCRADYQTKQTAELAACNAKTDPILKSSCISSTNTKYVALFKSCNTVNADLATVDSASKKCLRYENVTPGSIIAQQAANITNSPVRQLEYADKINEVLGSFFDQLVNRLFSQGLAGLSGNGSMNSQGVNVVLGTDGQPITNTATSAENVFGYQSINGGFNGEFDISRPQQLRAVLKAQLDYLSHSQDSQAIMATIVPTLGALDYCLPGPNPSWKVGTDFNMQLFGGALQGKPAAKALGSAISSISSIAVVIPGPGWIIAAVGAVVGQGLNLAAGSTAREVSSKDLQLFDKVTNGAQSISDFSMKHQRYFDSIDLVAYLEDSYKILIDTYVKQYTPDVITNLFQKANPGNDAFVAGRIAEILDETNNLVYYNQNIVAFSKEYDQKIASTQESIAALQAINTEIEQIVGEAKARYIKEQAAAGTPITGRIIDPITGVRGKLCIDQAYDVTTAPVVGTPRAIDPNAPIDPVVEQSRKAGNYFYNHL
jgi:spore coat protein CotF